MRNALGSFMAFIQRQAIAAREGFLVIEYWFRVHDDVVPIELRVQRIPFRTQADKFVPRRRLLAIEKPWGAEP